MRRGRRSRLLHGGLGLVTALVAAAVALALVFGALHLAHTVTSISSAPLRDLDVRAPGQRSETGLAARLDRGERVTILLLGYGGGHHDGAYLTDAMMMLSLDPAQRLVTMLSVPRDLVVTIPASRYARRVEAKVNEAFATPAADGDRDEGMRVARVAVEQVLGVPIDRTVAVDFSAFRTVVDALGGVDLTVDRSFAALYPRNDDASVDPSWMIVSFEAGPQHFDGEKALRFVRARYSDGPEGSDFARAARQQLVVLAVREKVFSASVLPRLFALLDALNENVRADLSIADLQALADYVRAHPDLPTQHVVLSPLNVLESTMNDVLGYALLPKTEGWSEVQAYARRHLDYPSSLDEHARVVVRVAPARLAAGEAARRRLGDLEFDVRLEIVREDIRRTTIEDSSGGRASESARFLADYFGDASISETGRGGPLVVYLGPDWSPPRELVLPHEEPAPRPKAAKPTPASR